MYSGIFIRWSTLGPPVVCSNGVLPNGPLMDTQYTNFAPRLGISYSPNSKLVIRTGYGIFFTQDIGNAYFDMARNIAGRVTSSPNNQDATTGIYGNSNLNWNNAIPSSGGTGPNMGPPTTAFANAVSHKTSYTEQYLLNIQQQIGQDWSFEVGYQGALSRHLYGFRNANPATPYGYIGTGVATSRASRVPFGNIGGLQYVHDKGTGNYNAFSVKATRRFSNGLNVISSYTWASPSTTQAEFATRATTTCILRTIIASNASTAVRHSMSRIGLLSRRFTICRSGRASCWRSKTKVWLR